MGSMHMFAINSHLLAIRTHIVVVGILLKVLFSTQGQLIDTRPNVVVGVHPTIVVVLSAIS